MSAKQLIRVIKWTCVPFKGSETLHPLWTVTISSNCLDIGADRIDRCLRARHRDSKNRHTHVLGSPPIKAKMICGTRRNTSYWESLWEVETRERNSSTQERGRALLLVFACYEHWHSHTDMSYSWGFLGSQVLSERRSFVGKIGMKRSSHGTRAREDGHKNRNGCHRLDSIKHAAICV